MLFDEGVRLDGARAPRVELNGCWVPALSARQLETRGDLTLNGLTGAREVVLAGAHIGGVLALRDARLAKGHGTVFDGAWLDVHLQMDCSRLQTTGEVSLRGAHIAGQLALAGARLSSKTAPALDADGLQVDGDMSCDEAADGQRFEATGGVSLVGAHIAGQLTFHGARLSNENGRALVANWLQVDGNMFCRERWRSFEATGGVRLGGGARRWTTELSRCPFEQRERIGARP